MSDLIEIGDRVNAFVKRNVARKGKGCWHLSGISHEKFHVNKKGVTIRRATYWYAFGVDIKGRQVVMSCGDPSCVSPYHVEPKGKKPFGKVAPSYRAKSRPSGSGRDFYSMSLAKKSKPSRPGDPSSFLVDADPGLPCVYAIRCRANGGVYVGKARNLARRSRQHVGRLGRNTHVNRRLQADWNKYGAQSFTMEILEVFDADDECTARESEIIYEFSVTCPSRLYNVVGNASAI